MSVDTKTRKVKYVFIASPGDLSAERKLFPRVLRRINKLKANQMGIQLEPLGWKDTLPAWGRPQELINKDVEECDLFVMLLWTRWGTAPAENSAYSSGTEEEFELARSMYQERKCPDILSYFRQVPEKMLADPGPELSKVLGFRKKIEAERSLLFAHYNNTKDWEDKLMDHIGRWLDGFLPIPAPLSAPIPPEIHQRIEQLEKELSRVTEEHRDAQVRLREAALEIGRRASGAAAEGHLTEAEELFARAIQTYPEPWVVNAFGLYYMQIGSVKRAEEKFLQLEQLGQEQEKKEYLATAYGNLGIVFRTLGDLATAEGMFRKSLNLSEQVGSKEGMADQYSNLALIHKTRGDLKKAETMQRKALALDEEQGHKEGMASDYGNLGLIYKDHGKFDTAEEMLRKALAIYEELRDKDGMAKTSGNLGLIHRARGDLDAAEEMHRKALTLNEELGRKEGIASQCGNLGLIYQHRRDLKAAEGMYRKALAINEQLGRKEGIAIQYHNLGTLLRERGEAEAAEEMLNRSLLLFQEMGAKPQADETQRILLELRQKPRKLKGKER